MADWRFPEPLRLPPGARLKLSIVVDGDERQVLEVNTSSLEVDGAPTEMRGFILTPTLRELVEEEAERLANIPVGQVLAGLMKRSEERRRKRKRNG